MPGLADDGYSIHADVLPAALAEPLAAAFAATTVDRAGFRGGLTIAAVRDLVTSAPVRALVEPVLGRDAFAFRATLFDKTPAANWLVAWHQDRVVPVGERRDVVGFVHWSQKDGRWFVEPPQEVLQKLLAVRVHVDAADGENGALRVLPGSHAAGVLSPEALQACARTGSPVTCVVLRGGAMCMRPLLVHASSRAVTAGHRRVVHIEFAPSPLPCGIAFADRVS